MKNLAMRSSIQGQAEKGKQQVRQSQSVHSWETNRGADRGTIRGDLHTLFTAGGNNREDDR